jgi:hypothetical protein
VTRSVASSQARALGFVAPEVVSFLEAVLFRMGDMTHDVLQFCRATTAWCEESALNFLQGSLMHSILSLLKGGSVQSIKEVVVFSYWLVIHIGQPSFFACFSEFIPDLCSAVLLGMESEDIEFVKETLGTIVKCTDQGNPLVKALVELSKSEDFLNILDRLSHHEDEAIAEFASVLLDQIS